MDELLLRRCVADGMTRKEIATMLDIPYSTISNYCVRHGIKTKRPDTHGKRPLCDNTKNIIELRKHGLSIKQIAKFVPVALSEICRICNKYGMGGPIVDQRLTEEMVADYVNRSGFDYVGGYQSQNKPITVKCRDCGRTFERQFHIFRDVVNGTWQCNNACPLCRADNQEEKAKRREALIAEKREREAQEKAQRKAEQLSRQVSDQLIRRLATRVCKNCGKEFCIELSDYRSEIYCSEACQKRCHDRIKRDKRIRRMKAREMDQDITLEKLFKRDGGACYLCGRMCDWEDSEVIDGQFVAGESYPSIDHVKPISKGGAHTWENIKLACRHCNTVKGWR